MPGEVPHSWGSERRGWHVNKTVDLTVIATVVIFLIGIGTGFAVWYSEINSQLTAAFERDQTLQEADERLAKMIVDSEDRNRERIEAQAQRSERRFSELRQDIRDMKGYLDRIMVNTSYLTPEGRGDGRQTNDRAD